MMIHAFIANICLLNYLIAILSTVYEIMFVDGEFAYKKYKYRFIEKYNIAFLDEKGFYELVIHPPPLNYFTVPLYIFIIKQDSLPSAAKVYSKINFWFENFFFLFFFMAAEVVMYPLTFLK